MEILDTIRTGWTMRTGQPLYTAEEKSVFEHYHTAIAENRYTRERAIKEMSLRFNRPLPVIRKDFDSITGPVAVPVTAKRARISTSRDEEDLEVSSFDERNNTRNRSNMSTSSSNSSSSSKRNRAHIVVNVTTTAHSKATTTVTSATGADDYGYHIADRNDQEQSDLESVSE